VILIGALAAGAAAGFAVLALRDASPIERRLRALGTTAGRPRHAAVARTHVDPARIAGALAGALAGCVLSAAWLQRRIGRQEIEARKGVLRLRRIPKL